MNWVDREIGIGTKSYRWPLLPLIVAEKLFCRFFIHSFICSLQPEKTRSDSMDQSTTYQRIRHVCWRWNKKWVGFRLITFIEFIWRRNNSFGDAVALCGIGKYGKSLIEFKFLKIINELFAFMPYINTYTRARTRLVKLKYNAANSRSLFSAHLKTRAFKYENQ